MKTGKPTPLAAISAIPANHEKLNSRNSKNSRVSPLKLDGNCAFAHDPETSGADFASGGSLTTEWMTTEEAAAYLKVSVGSLRNMTSNGHVPYYKLQGRNRYRLDDLRNLLLSHRKGGF